MISVWLECEKEAKSVSSGEVQSPVVDVAVDRVVPLRSEVVQRAWPVPAALLEVLHPAREPRSLHDARHDVRGNLHLAPGRKMEGPG